jgi:hypothetical protein
MLALQRNRKKEVHPMIAHARPTGRPPIAGESNL